MQVYNTCGWDHNMNKDTAQNKCIIVIEIKAKEG